MKTLIIIVLITGVTVGFNSVKVMENVIEYKQTQMETILAMGK